MQYAIIIGGENLFDAVKRLKRAVRRGKVRPLYAIVVVEAEPEVLGPVVRGVAKLQRLEEVEVRVSVIVLGRR